MRHVLFAILVAVPSALVGWIIARGQDTREMHGGPIEARSTAAANGKSDGRAGSRAGDGKPAEGDPADGDSDAVLRALFATPMAGAKVQGEVELYDEKGLFDYINGAAPIFIERSFRMLAAAEMAVPDGGELTCDVYDMKAADNARSIFEKERSPTATPVPDWPEAIAGPQSFVFHESAYYVKLTAFDKPTEALLPEIASALRQRMQ